MKQKKKQEKWAYTIQISFGDFFFTSPSPSPVWLICSTFFLPLLLSPASTENLSPCESRYRKTIWIHHLGCKQFMCTVSGPHIQHIFEVLTNSVHITSSSSLFMRLLSSPNLSPLFKCFNGFPSSASTFFLFYFPTISKRSRESRKKGFSSRFFLKFNCPTTRH